MRRCRPAPEDRAVAGGRTPRSAALRAPEPRRSETGGRATTCELLQGGSGHPHLQLEKDPGPRGTSGTSDPRTADLEPRLPRGQTEFQSPARVNRAPGTLPGHRRVSRRPAQASQAAEGRTPAAPSSPSRPWAAPSAPVASPWGLAPSRPRASFFVSELALQVM